MSLFAGGDGWKERAERRRALGRAFLNIVLNERGTNPMGMQAMKLLQQTSGLPGLQNAK